MGEEFASPAVAPGTHSGDDRKGFTVQTVTRSDDDLRGLVASRRGLCFGDRSNRDRAAKLAGPTWRKSSVRDQLLDAHYVDDATDRTDYGLGNQKQFWSTLYLLDPR